MFHGVGRRNKNSAVYFCARDIFSSQENKLSVSVRGDGAQWRVNHRAVGGVAHQWILRRDARVGLMPTA